MMVLYYLYNWTPPALSPSEKIAMGKEIAKVGRVAFANVLIKRLSQPSGGKISASGKSSKMSKSRSSE